MERNRKEYRKMVLALCIVIIFAVISVERVHGIEETQTSGQPRPAAETKVASLVMKKTLHVKSAMKDTISLSPAYGRTVELQRYDSSKKKWEVKKRYKTGNVKSAKVVLHYPSTLWNKQKYTKWRIYLPATKQATSYRSNQITITTKNRSPLNLSCKGAVIMNADTGIVLYDKAMNGRRAQASITKIMTAMVALEQKSTKTAAVISEKAQNTPYASSLLKKGDKIYLRDLLYAALLPSDNGSAVAIAEHTAGSTSKFVRQMNQKAKALGCKNTRYTNTHGLDNSSHYSSAYDTALITRAALKNSSFRKIVKTKKYSFVTIKKKIRFNLESTNKLLGEVTGICGVKTGTTGSAGRCFAGAYAYKGQKYITVALGSGSDKARWEDTKKLIRYTRKYGW